MADAATMADPVPPIAAAIAGLGSARQTALTPRSSSPRSLPARKKLSDEVVVDPSHGEAALRGLKSNDQQESRDDSGHKPPQQDAKASPRPRLDLHG